MQRRRMRVSLENSESILETARRRAMARDGRRHVEQVDVRVECSHLRAAARLGNRCQIKALEVVEASATADDLDCEGLLQAELSVRPVTQLKQARLLHPKRKDSCRFSE